VTALRSAAPQVFELPFTRGSFSGIFLTLELAVIHLHAWDRELELKVAMGELPPMRL
jgi:hypothetical protein